MALNDPNDPFFNECLAQFNDIFRYVRACVRSVQDAEDYTQDVFAQALAKRHQFDGQNLPAWLYQIARNSVAKAFRRRAMERRNLQRAARFPIASSDPSQNAEEGEASLRAIEALETLSEIEREALRLKFATKYSNTQIAQMLNVTQPHFNVIVFRALRKLRQTLSRGAGVER